MATRQGNIGVDEEHEKRLAEKSLEESWAAGCGEGPGY